MHTTLKQEPRNSSCRCGIFPSGFAARKQTPTLKNFAANMDHARPSICSTRTSKIPSVPPGATGVIRTSKYERLISFLPDRRYGNALDIGCGLGPFTRHLAPHADRVLGVDISEEAIQGARALSAGQPNLVFERRDVLSIGEMDRQFDLIALLDVLYYLSPLSADVLQAGRLADRSAAGTRRRSPACQSFLLRVRFGIAADPQDSRRVFASIRRCALPRNTGVLSSWQAFSSIARRPLPQPKIC